MNELPKSVVAAKMHYENNKLRPSHAMNLEQFSRPWFEACDKKFVKALRDAHPLDEIRNFRRRTYGVLRGHHGKDNPYDD